MILHIPHSSDRLPNDKMIVEHKSVQHLTDWFTEYLFDSVGAVDIIFPYSRLFCDVERLINDPLESEGQGIMYTVGHNGETIDMKKYGITDEQRMEVYTNHHKLLKSSCEMQLALNEKCVIVDCHSYSDVQAKRKNNPDICIGTNPSTSKELTNLVYSKFIEKGYTVGLNFPYGNSILPFNEEMEGLESIMIEVHKRLYMNEVLVEYNDGFHKLKNDIDEVLELIKDYEFTINAS